MAKPNAHNAEVLHGLKTRSFDPLKKREATWITEMHSVLWSLRTTPFFLVYGAEEVLPAEIMHGAPRVANYDEASKDARRDDDVNFLEETRCCVVIRNTQYQQSLQLYHECRVCPRSIQADDLILRRAQLREGKDILSPMWECPVLVMQVSRPSSARPASVDGVAEPSAWNIEHLRKFYP